MEVNIKGEPKEIAALVVGLQGQPKKVDNVMLAETFRTIFSQQKAQAESGTLFHSCN